MLNPKNNMPELQENLLTISNVFENLKKLNVKFFSKAELLAREQELLARQQAELLARQQAELLAQQQELLAYQGFFFF
jgi:hypothetical protein